MPSSTNSKSRKTPARCTGLADVRVEVNRIDRALVRLLGERQRYALAATRFKSDAASVKRPDHLPAFFAARRDWAAQAALDPALIDRIFGAITAESMKLQLALLRRRTSRRPKKRVL